ncbi:MAG: hypothetical protein K9M17_05570 [Mariprofundaceae bacterium]|nr:hypothetical protein [Mariprofundaceae bacterium]
MAGNANRRSTIYFDEKLHKVLRLKAAETHRTVSELVNVGMFTDLFKRP